MSDGAHGQLKNKTSGTLPQSLQNKRIENKASKHEARTEMKTGVQGEEKNIARGSNYRTCNRHIIRREFAAQKEEIGQS